jgi:predicted anti-sigma-YlaC factor YlaD
MNRSEHEELIAQLCDAMGEDLDAPFCREVAEHLANCPQCKEQFDSVKRTVKLCREHGNQEKIPKDVSARLLKILNLQSSQK